MLIVMTDVTGGGRLTFGQGTAMYVGAVLGTGVIALPALAAEAAGPAGELCGSPADGLRAGG
jgi:amino acid efflux transporter